LLVGAVVLTQLVFFGEEVAHVLLGTNTHSHLTRISLASHAHPTRISLATRSSLLAPKCFFNNFRKKIAKSRFLQPRRNESLKVGSCRR
jgi:hypothetical protein